MCIVNDISNEVEEAMEIRDTANQMRAAYEQGKNLYDPEHDMTPDELYRVIEQDIDAIYATKWYAYIILGDEIVVLDACHAQNMHDK